MAEIKFQFVLTMLLNIALTGLVACQVQAREFSIGLNFSGSNLSESGFRPPDTMGTVGMGHVVEMINGRYRVYDKTNGALLENRSLNSFWSNANAPHAGNFSFDPRVQYDPTTDRYYATSVDNARGPNNLLVAVSKTSNPLDGWDGFAVDSDSDNLQWADFPQMGFSNDALVISANMFAINNADFEINTLVIPKADLTAPVPTIANATLLEDQFAASGFNFSLQPALDLSGSGRPLRLFTTNSTAEDRIAALEILNPVTAPSFDVLPEIPVNFLDSPPLADQPGPKPDLDSGGNRTRSAIALIDDHYFGVHGVEVGGRAAQRWYKIDADTLELVDEGTIASNDLDFIYGSIAANELGDVVVGYTAVGPNEFASAYVSVGGTDASGNVTFGDPTLLKEGVSDYDQTNGGTRNRWGDYSATVIDPENPNVFWTFQEWVSAEDQWSVQVTQLVLNNVGDFDGDGDYDCADVNALVGEIAGMTNANSFDLTGDGNVDGDDLDAWLNEAGEANLGPGRVFLDGDANLDGFVDTSDFNIRNENKFTETPEWCSGDFTADGFVDGSDFNVWNENKFTSSDVHSVPEPDSVLLLTGLTLFLVARWRR